MKKICLTGVNGFLGKSICQALINSNKSIRALARTIDHSFNSSEVEYIQIKDIRLEQNLKEYLTGCNFVIHCAGKAHLINDKSNLDIYRLANFEVTKHLAEQAVAAGVKRFIFLSSAKVNGETTGKPDGSNIFTNNDMANPQDNYAMSKLEAEKALWEIASKTNLEVVVVRLPLVYGYGAKSNLKNLMKLINSKIPLPFGGIKNKRSLIGIDNLVDVLIRCMEHPNAAGQTFLISDGEDLSTPELILLIASAMGQPIKLFSIPKSILKFLGFILGKQKEMCRITESLQIDNSYAKQILNWTPPVSVKEGIRRMIKGK
jgi:nucleoside-diphosphate-sugar epimerase